VLEEAVADKALLFTQFREMSDGLLSHLSVRELRRSAGLGYEDAMGVFRVDCKLWSVRSSSSQYRKRPWRLG
jgi:hypothetical protein